MNSPYQVHYCTIRYVNEQATGLKLSDEKIFVWCKIIRAHYIKTLDSFENDQWWTCIERSWNFRFRFIFRFAIRIFSKWRGIYADLCCICLLPIAFLFLLLLMPQETRFLKFFAFICGEPFRTTWFGVLAITYPTILLMSNIFSLAILVSVVFGCWNTSDKLSAFDKVSTTLSFSWVSLCFYIATWATSDITASSS